MKLSEIASLIRSKNAGPFIITVDVMLKDDLSYEWLTKRSSFGAADVGALYSINPSDVRVSYHPTVTSIKYSFPRQTPSGGEFDTDVLGCQFHGPLCEVELGELGA